MVLGLNEEKKGMRKVRAFKCWMQVFGWNS